MKQTWLQLHKLLKISRPRFYPYLLGPYAIGAILAVDTFNELTNALYLLGFMYFTFPANLLIYGINDLFDRDTDQHNTKKGKYEHKLHLSDTSLLTFVILVCGVITLLFAWQLPTLASWYLFAFIVLGVGYSVPPIRFKARPFIDAVSNVLYILPAGVGLAMGTQSVSFFSIPVLAACLWAVGMHCISAIPDIAADTRAGLKTTAVVLGHVGASYFVAGVWLLAVLLSIPSLGIISSLFFVYPILALLMARSAQKAHRIYSVFPLLNTLLGMVLFWVAVFSK